MRKACVVSLLREHKDALDVIEEASRIMKDAPSILTVGNYSFPNMLGALQFDTSIPDSYAQGRCW